MYLKTSRAPEIVWGGDNLLRAPTASHSWCLMARASHPNSPTLPSCRFQRELCVPKHALPFCLWFTCPLLATRRSLHRPPHLQWNLLPKPLSLLALRRLPEHGRGRGHPGSTLWQFLAHPRCRVGRYHVGAGWGTFPTPSSTLSCEKAHRGQVAALGVAAGAPEPSCASPKVTLLQGGSLVSGPASLHSH